MSTLRELKKQYALKQISEEEYQQKKDALVERLVQLYFREYITLEELKERIK